MSLGSVFYRVAYGISAGAIVAAGTWNYFDHRQFKKDFARVNISPEARIEECRKTLGGCETDRSALLSCLERGAKERDTLGSDRTMVRNITAGIMAVGFFGVLLLARAQHVRREDDKVKAPSAPQPPH